MTDSVLPGTGKAGGSADAKFKSMARDWRRARIRRPQLVILALAVVALLGGAGQGHVLAFYLGVATGALFMLWFSIRELLLPSYITKWQLGAEGEKDTGKVLKKLGPDWMVEHDMQGRFGNVDHMVIGDAGVFVIDTKAWYQGTTVITADGPTVTPDHDPDVTWQWFKVPNAMKGSAGGASNAILALGGRRISVRPVVAIWGDFPGGVQERGGVTYIAAEHLADWLTSLPPQLSPADREVLSRLF